MKLIRQTHLERVDFCGAFLQQSVSHLDKEVRTYVAIYISVRRRRINAKHLVPERSTRFS